MKRFFALLLVCCLTLGGCGSGGVSQEEYDKVVAERDALKKQVDSLEETNQFENETETVASEETVAPEETVTPEETAAPEETAVQEEAVEILAEYTLPDGIGWYTRHFMVVRNNSSETVDISTSSLAYSEDGNMVGAGNASFDALGSGCTSVLCEAFETDVKIDHYETELNSSESKYYESVIQDLSYVQNDIDGGAVFQVTNNGEDVAKFVEGYALFFLNGELVGYERTYFTDDNSEIKAGKTISKQMDSREDFDTIEFYLTGTK